MEKERTIKETHYTNPLFTPLTSIDENTSIDFHANGSMAREDKTFQIWNTRHTDHDSLVKMNCTCKPVGDCHSRELNNFRFHRRAENGTQCRCKPLVTTNMHMRALAGEKENVESHPTHARLCFSSSKTKASTTQPKGSRGLLDVTDLKRSQEGYVESNNPLTQVEVNILGEASSGQDVRRGKCGILATFLKGSQNVCLQRTDLNCNLEGPVCRRPDSHQTSAALPLTILVRDETSCGSLQSIESVKVPFSSTTESMKTPLLSGFPDQSCHHMSQEKPFLPNKNPCDVRMEYPETARPLLSQSIAHCMERSSCELSDYSILSQSQSNQDTRTCEDFNRDHLVVFFSAQKFLEENVTRLNRQKFSKVSSLYALYSRKILCWIKSVCREQTFVSCLRRVRQIFSPSTRGFVDLDSQKMPEFPIKMSSSMRKKLAEDNELRGVLLKINEVLASTKRISSDVMQENERSVVRPHNQSSS